jgi:hypothetical protein
MTWIAIFEEKIFSCSKILSLYCKFLPKFHLFFSLLTFYSFHHQSWWAKEREMHKHFVSLSQWFRKLEWTKTINFATSRPSTGRLCQCVCVPHLIILLLMLKDLLTTESADFQPFRPFPIVIKWDRWFVCFYWSDEKKTARHTGVEAFLTRLF